MLQGFLNGEEKKNTRFKINEETKNKTKIIFIIGLRCIVSCYVFHHSIITINK